MVKSTKSEIPVDVMLKNKGIYWFDSILDFVI